MPLVETPRALRAWSSPGLQRKFPVESQFKSFQSEPGFGLHPQQGDISVNTTPPDLKILSIRTRWAGKRRPNCALQPGPRKGPMPVHRARREAEGSGNLRNSHTDEVAQLHHFGSLRIFQRQSRE